MGLTWRFSWSFPYWASHVKKLADKMEFGRPREDRRKDVKKPREGMTYQLCWSRERDKSLTDPAADDWW
jgi:hypothetical protein